MKTLIIIAALLVAGCSTEVKINHINAAITLCKERGGVLRMWSDINAWHTQCIDGTRMYSVGEPTR